jgi:hypothetical protein
MPSRHTVTNAAPTPRKAQTRTTGFILWTPFPFPDGAPPSTRQDFAALHPPSSRWHPRQLENRSLQPGLASQFAYGPLRRPRIAEIMLHMHSRRVPSPKDHIPTHGVLIDRRTGKEVGPRVPVNPSDWPYQLLAPSEILWRYMDIRKFRDILEKSALYFARQDRFTDPFEGRYSEGNLVGYSPTDQAFYDTYRIDRARSQAHDQIETHRHCVFISCWHRNKRESRQMWDAYTKGPDSVVIATSAGALYRFIPDEIMKSPVKYHRPQFPRSETFGWNTLSFYKPSCYSFEREFRMLRNLGKDESVAWDNPSDFGRYVAIRPKKIIHRVITHPKASFAFKKDIDLLLHRHLKAIRREDSALR